MQPEALKLLLLEDSLTYAAAAERTLQRAELRFVMRRVERRETFIAELHSFQPDVVVADYSLPGFDGLAALQIVRQHAADTPIVVFSGALGDERAVELLKLGATDYVLKDRMDRLPAAVLRARREALDAAQRRRNEASLLYRLEFEQIIRSFSAEFIGLDAEAIDDGIWRVLRRIGEFVGVDRSYAFTISADGQYITSTYEWCRAGIVPRVGRLKEMPAATFLWGRQPPAATLRLPDVKAAMGAAGDLRSLLAVPIAPAGRHAGFVGFETVRSPAEWNEDTVALLENVASIFYSAVERKSHDLSLRREKEFVASIIDTSRNLVAVVDRKGRFVRVNKAFEAVIRTGDAASAASLAELWAIAEETRAALSLQREVILATRRGERRTILWDSCVIRGDGNHVLLTGTDLTEMRSLEGQVEQSRRVESLGRMAAGIAHEFNNVLMGISPYAELLRRAEDENTRKAGERIGNAVLRGQRITQEVMRFTTPAHPHVQPIDARQWLLRFGDDFRAGAGKEVVLQLEFPQDDLSMLVDPLQLEQVFTNLASNARDAMNGRGTLTITVDQVLETDCPFVHFAVSDTGDGIPPDVLATMFEPLVTTKRSGTGLGLTVSCQIIQANGGRIFAESEVGRGTTFHVLLPSAR
jgi:signal transduction histidine kinase/ActR/RegA family two-component response regulator